MISIVVPAHNEAAVLARCLTGLLRDAQPGELEIIVAANGCTDDTVGIATGFGAPVRVVNVPVASKTAALNAGDRVAAGFPRLYVDADVVLDTEAVRAVAGALAGHLAASPGLVMDTSRSRPVVRSYYRFWSLLPSVRDSLVGRGVYAVSEAGRRRFDAFPDVLNDDNYFRDLFAPAECTVVGAARSTVEAPRTLSALIKRKTRVQLGNQASGGSHSAWSGVGTVLRAEPARIVDLPAFAAVAVVARLRAGIAPGAATTWQRDDSRPA